MFSVPKPFLDLAQAAIARLAADRDIEALAVERQPDAAVRHGMAAAQEAVLESELEVVGTAAQGQLDLAIGVENDAPAIRQRR